MFLLNLIFLSSVLLRCLASCEDSDISSTAAGTDIPQLVQKYEDDVNVSKISQKEDRRLMASWADEFQIRRLDVTMEYRMQMMKHHENMFKSEGNIKWADCLLAHKKEIRRSVRFYHDNEHECLRAATSKDDQKKEDVEQLEKQIAKWRKAYRYLVNLCHDENPGDKEGADQCLVEYMQSDNYDDVIERLLDLKRVSISYLYSQYNASVMALKVCLKTQLTRYVDRIRALMELLNKCYDVRT